MTNEVEISNQRVKIRLADDAVKRAKMDMQRHPGQEMFEILHLKAVEKRKHEKRLLKQMITDFVNSHQLKLL